VLPSANISSAFTSYSNPIPDVRASWLPLISFSHYPSTDHHIFRLLSCIVCFRIRPCASLPHLSFIRANALQSYVRMVQKHRTISSAASTGTPAIFSNISFARPASQDGDIELKGARIRDACPTSVGKVDLYPILSFGCVC
jgi:hypothetical protein